MNNLTTSNVPKKDDTGDLIISILLSIITCGIYAIFWQARQISEMNRLLRVEKYNFWTWLLLSIVTCGIYYVYHEYIMAEDIYKIQLEKNISNPAANLSVISLILSIFGLHIITDAIQQHEINRILNSAQ